MYKIKNRSGLRKFTQEQANEIRHRYNLENITFKQLSKEYNVSGGCISNIVNNKYYKELLNENIKQ